MLTWHEKDIRVLRQAHCDFARLLIYLDIYQEAPTRDLMHRVHHCTEIEEVRAALHHLSCQSMRVISALPVCNQRCCCHCPAATVLNGCNSELLNAGLDFEPQRN